MNILNKFDTLYSSINHFRHYLSIFCALSLVSFSSCSDTNWEQIDSKEVLLASSTSSNLANSVQQNEFEKIVLDFSSDNQLKEYIHPQLGFYVNHKPSAISIVEHFRNLNEVYEYLPHLEPYFKKINAENPKNEEIPKFDCENFSKEGTFYQLTSSFNEIEKGMETDESIIQKVHSEEEIEVAKQIDKKITHIVVLTDDYLEIGFTNIDGKWYMLWFNLAKFDCSA